MINSRNQAAGTSECDCVGMLEVLGILLTTQDFRARTPEKGIAAMDGDAIPVRPASITYMQNA